MRIPARVVLVLFTASLLAAGCSPSAAQPGGAAGFFDEVDLGWIGNPYWFDGTAEVNLYRATLVKYGQPRPADEVAHIVVTEDHKPDLLVKADDWRQAGLVGMLKLNYVASVRTGVYPYHQMLSFFFDRADLHLAKMTLTSHEWCGNSFKELVNFRGRSSYEFNTYWDGQGNGSFDVELPADLVAYESLPVQLRGLAWRAGLETTLNLLAPQLSSRAGEPQWSAARLTVGEKEKVTVPAGDFAVWPVVLEHAGGEDRLAFEADFPHRMIRWQASSGDLFELRTAKKLAYWQLNGPGDERYLED
jgi:hypothetical protein